MVSGQRLLNLYAQWLLRRPIASCVLAVVITIVAAAGLARLSFDDGLVRTFESRAPAFSAFQEHQRMFGPRGREVAVHIKVEDLEDPENFDLVHDFVLSLALVIDVDRVESMFSLRSAAGKPDETKPVISADLETRTDIAQSLEAVTAHPLNRGRLLSEDRKNLLAIVRLVPLSESSLSQVLEEIEGNSASIFNDRDIGISVTGLPVLRLRVIENLVRDQAVINLIGAFVGVLFCFIAFRSVLLTLVAGVPAVVSLIWVLGFFGMIGIPITTVTNALPVLIMVLAFADSMHLTQEIRRQAVDSNSLKFAIQASIRRTGPACILTSMTTAIAFISLYLSQSAQVRDLAIAGSLAVLISLAAVLLLNPLLAWWLLSRLAKNQSNNRHSTRLFFANAFWDAAMKLVTNRSRAFAWGGVALVCVGATVYSGIETRYSFQENVSDKSSEWQQYNDVEQTFVPLSTISVIVPLDNQEGGITKDALAYIGRLHDTLADIYGERQLVSLWSLANWINPDDPTSTSQQLNTLLAQQDNPTTFISADGSATRIEIFTEDRGSTYIRAQQSRIEEIAIDTKPAHLDDLWASGLLTMSASVSASMINDLHYSFLAAVLASGVLIVLWTRNVKVGLAATIVNFLPIIMVGAWLTVSGNGLQFTSALALTIAFGIAVDDTLHALNRLRPTLLTHRQISVDQINDAFSSIAPILFATTLILCAGIASTAASTMPMIVYFGQLSIFVFILALLADLIVLPALLAQLLVRKRP